MKYAIIILLLVAALLLMYGCQSTQQAEQPLIGLTTSEQLLTDFPAFTQSYDQYSLSEHERALVASWPDNLKISVFFGTWCHDSQREVPHLLKLLSNHPTIQLEMVALDHTKSDPSGLAVANAVKYTPTFIIYRDDKEVGRIVERPKQSIVSDINRFLTM